VAEHRDALPQIHLEDDLRVGSCFELDPGLDHLFAKIAIIVELSIIDENHIIVGHRLACCCGKINDRKTSMSEPRLSIFRNPRAGTIWPPVSHASAHAFEFLFFKPSQVSGDSTHRCLQNRLDGPTDCLPSNQDNEPSKIERAA